MSQKLVATDYHKYAILNAEEESSHELSDEHKNALMHHGVIGMKWGVRRYQDYGEGGYNPKHKGKFIPKKHKEDDAASVVKNMSDDELNKRLNRLRKEQEFIRLSSQDTKKGKGLLKKYNNTAGEVLKAGTTTVALIALGNKVIKKIGPLIIK